METLTKTVETARQQNNNGDRDKDQADRLRRSFYPCRFNFPIHLVEDLAFYFDKLNRVDILLIRYLCLGSQYEKVKVTGINSTEKEQIFVDLAESRWQWRTKIAQQISKKLEKPITKKQIEKSELKLQEKGIVRWATLNEAGKNQTRVICFTRHFMVIAKGIMTKMPDLPNEHVVSVSPKKGQGVSPKKGQGVPKTGKNESYLSNPPKTMNDDVGDTPTRPVDNNTKVATPTAASSSSNKFSRRDLFKIVNMLPITGAKPFEEINPFIVGMAEKYGTDSCMEVVQSLHNYKVKQEWDETTKKGLERLIEERSDPKAAEEKRKAQEANRALKAKKFHDAQVRGNYLQHIDALEKGIDSLQPMGPCPDDMLDRLNKAKKSISAPSPESEAGAMALLTALVPKAARNLKNYKGEK